MSRSSNSPDPKSAKPNPTPSRQPKRMGKRTASQSQATQKALLEAAAAAFAEHGLSGAKLEAIADRAGVTKGAIYSHYNSREDLLVKACRAALRELNLFEIAKDAPNIETFINKTLQAILAPEGRAFRMLNIEVHLSATRSQVMADLLAEWHAEGLATLRDRLPAKLGSPEAVFSMINFLFLGLSHFDALNSIDAQPDELLVLAKKLAASLVTTDAD